ncbi:MAG: hypothetical protein QGG42_06815, partial [Phycisphaerae bacterium]|nr:hypothetical protein [Phycisphaerae bacterium]
SLSSRRYANDGGQVKNVPRKILSKQALRGTIFVERRGRESHPLVCRITLKNKRLSISAYC